MSKISSTILLLFVCLYYIILSSACLILKYLRKTQDVVDFMFFMINASYFLFDM